VIKLKREFEFPLPIKRSPSDIVAMTSLMPLPDRRCLAFGWAMLSDDPSPREERYWMAQFGPDGVRHRILDPAVTAHLVALTARPNDSSGSYTRVHAFAHAGGFALLFGSHEVHLYPDLESEPTVLRIENSFATLGAPHSPNARRDSHYLPLRIGHAFAGDAPVMLASPEGGLGEASHACVLHVDAATRTARWLHTDVEGHPPRLRFADFAAFLDSPDRGGLRMDRGALTWDKPPLLLDAAWHDDQWLTYIGGFHGAAHRYGLPLSLLARHRPDLALEAALFTAGEESFGRLAASREHLILSPLRKNGPAKGKQTILALGDREAHALKLPTGCAKHHVLDVGEGTWWLSPMPWGYAAATLVACSPG
jgi:hypothetical protein